MTFVALVAGVSLGLAVNALNLERLIKWGEWAAPAGRAWVATLRVIVVPLVVCLLITGLAGTRGKLVGKIGAISFTAFIAILLSGAVAAVTLAPMMLRLLRVQPGVLVDSGSTGPVTTQRSTAPSVGEFLRSFHAGDMAATFCRAGLFPIIVVTVLIAVAMTWIEQERRQLLLGFFERLRSVVQVVMSWVLFAAPVAVFVLSYAMAARLGLSVAHALGAFVLVISVLLAGMTLAMYPTAALLGRVSPRDFAAAAAPAQAVAIGTRSSIAALPALIEAGRRLGVSPSVNDFVTPLAVSVFKANRAISGTVKMLFLSQVYGIEVGPAMVVAYAGMEVLLSFSTPGTPSAGMMTSAPALLAFGIPMEGIVLIHAVYVLPDVVMTLTNVTADLAVVTIVNRFAGNRGATSSGTAELARASDS